MLISEYINREEILSEVSKELRKHEIKIRSEKHQKNLENKRRINKKIFKIQLNHQIVDNALFSNGQCSAVPRFVLQACQKIQKESKTEGIFRKTGSVKKQQEIKDYLENGGSLNDKNFNVIDIANLLKKYFRELPEPLIPQGMIQDTLIKCLIYCTKYEEKVEALLMTCMFLSPIAVNTLAYFLQFLEVIIKHSAENFMTLDNLVRVLTPTIMPLPLNAPEKRLQSHFKVLELLIENANLIGVIPDRMIKRDDMNAVPMTEERKKKKRRSGSLNRVFTNFKKKLVGSLGSSESLDKSHENTIEDITMMTPNVTKSTKKRRLERLDVLAFSSKKKKDPAPMMLTSLPEIDDSPYAQRKPEYRNSLGEVNQSIVSPKECTNNETIIKRREEEYVRVPKSEYEAFKTRLHCIETKITHEFNTVKLNAVKAELKKKKFNGPEEVESKFHETLQEVEKIEDSERKTEQLAKRLSRELKIRPQLENPVIRSPSARKIGSLRRRQEKNTRLSRNQSWHLGPSALNPKPDNSPEKNKTLTSTLSFYPKPTLKRARLVDSGLIQETQTLPQIPQSTEKVVPEKPVRKSININVNPIASEVWMPATDFFNDTKSISSHNDESKVPDIMFKTPNRPNRKFTAANEIDMNKTPMLPPKMTPNRKYTPMSEKKTPSMNKTMMLTPSMNEAREGRASIIQIRNQNAGMVAQKAKLFDDLSADLTKSVDRSIKIPRVIVNKKLENVKNMNMEISQNQVPSNSTHSPRRSSRSPGINRRMNLRISTQSPVLKTIKENANENRNNRVNLLKSDVLNEIASPRNRKVLSQNNTPRRNSKTPKNSSTKKHRTPRSSSKKSMRRHQISFD
ncbi:ralA-binding protein 1-like isoform X2 [Chironomus tepperi]|uniref:ralA-binding protein 1-like isoform X2 n=1 Tax=Chironomus tepperi TaxID=113505 RepID=UPI00391F02A5